MKAILFALAVTAFGVLTLPLSPPSYADWLTIQACSTTVTDDPNLPGGLTSLTVMSGPNSVTESVSVVHANAGSGLRTLTVLSAANVIVNVPAFTPGTVAPVTVPYMRGNPSLPVDFTLRARSSFHGILIRVKCDAPRPTPTPTAPSPTTPTPMPSPSPTPTPTPSPTPMPSPTPTPLPATKAVSWPSSQTARNALFIDFSSRGYLGFVTNSTFFGFQVCEPGALEVEIVPWPSTKTAQSQVFTAQAKKRFRCSPAGSWLYCSRLVF